MLRVENVHQIQRVKNRRLISNRKSRHAPEIVYMDPLKTVLKMSVNFRGSQDSFTRLRWRACGEPPWASWRKSSPWACWRKEANNRYLNQGGEWTGKSRGGRPNASGSECMWRVGPEYLHTWHQEAAHNLNFFKWSDRRRNRRVITR